MKIFPHKSYARRYSENSYNAFLFNNNLEEQMPKTLPQRPHQHHLIWQCPARPESGVYHTSVKRNSKQILLQSNY